MQNLRIVNPDSNSISGMPKMDAKRAQRKRRVIQWEEIASRFEKSFAQFSYVSRQMYISGYDTPEDIKTEL